MAVSLCVSRATNTAMLTSYTRSRGLLHAALEDDGFRSDKVLCFVCSAAEPTFCLLEMYQLMGRACS